MCAGWTQKKVTWALRALEHRGTTIHPCRRLEKSPNPIFPVSNNNIFRAEEEP